MDEEDAAATRGKGQRSAELSVRSQLQLERAYLPRKLRVTEGHDLRPAATGKRDDGRILLLKMDKETYAVGLDMHGVRRWRWKPAGSTWNFIAYSSITKKESQSSFPIQTERLGDKKNKPFSLTRITFWVCGGRYPALHMAVRRQSSVWASVNGQPNVLAQRKTNSTKEAAVAALGFGIPGVPLCTSAWFTCRWPDQTPGQTEPQHMHHITSHHSMLQNNRRLLFQFDTADLLIFR